MTIRTRSIAWLLAVLLVLQCFAVTGFAHEDEPADLPTDDPTLAEPPSDEPAPAELRIVPSLADGTVVHDPIQTLTVAVLLDGAAVEPDSLTVTADAPIEPVDGGYPLVLARGNNALTITAALGGQEASCTLNLRFEIAIPDGWAHDALAFCVENGILNGNDHGDLQPTGRASRAQLAAMLVRLFAATPEADLSAYSDVPETAWYRADMARAVAMGIFEGSDGKLTPSRSITREQAFTVLARAFGVASADTDLLAAYSDGRRVSAWAQAGVTGLLEAGYIHGNSNGTLNPKGNITRQELAQVLYNAISCITDDPDALAGGNCLYTGDLAALEGRSFGGNLIVSSPAPEDAVVRGLTVGGRLVLQLHGAKTAFVDAACQSLSVCSPVVLTLGQKPEVLRCVRGGIDVRADADTVYTAGPCLLRGSYGEVLCLSGETTLTADATADTLTLTPNLSGGTVSVYGKARQANVYATSATLDGTGRIDAVYAYRNGLQVRCTAGKVEDRIDAGLSGVTLTPGKTPTAYLDVPKVTVSATVSGVNTTQVYGVPDGVRTCTATFTYQGKVISTQTVRLTDGLELSVQITPELPKDAQKKQYVTLTLAYGAEMISKELPLYASGYYEGYQEALSIRTIYVQGTLYYTTGMYSTSSLTGYIGSISGGTEVVFLKYGEVAALIQLKDGRKVWVPRGAVRVSWQNYHNETLTYSTAAKEAFVNRLHNYSSPTKYLIWCNLYTTTVNIFEGSQGNWKLIQSSKCTIGAPDSPTRPGVYSIYSRTAYWTFDGPPASRCYYPSLFDGGIAFHTRLYYVGTNTMVNPALGAELSHGCVRCPDEIAKFIYTQCPYGTTVVVF